MHIKRFCEGFHTFCPNFHIFCPDFHQIKAFGGALSPPASYTTVRQHRTTTKLPKAFHEEHDRILFLGRQNLCVRLWHAPKISRRIAGE